MVRRGFSCVLLLGGFTTRQSAPPLAAVQLLQLLRRWHALQCGCNLLQPFQCCRVVHASLLQFSDRQLVCLGCPFVEIRMIRYRESSQLAVIKIGRSQYQNNHERGDMPAVIQPVVEVRATQLAGNPRLRPET
ncbi:hypothetical protein DFJ74DRAFT_688180 [Hyaloraphidium curvatum]|nr:hypothetical protein DFJ74DRAFT_688180 [Hyaloraphidium curvatum]